METILSQTRSLESEKKLEEVKAYFEHELKTQLQLTAVNAPLFVPKNSGLNDDLNGIETPVSFSLQGEEYQVVHSLAKWKRWYLGELKAPIGKGLVTNMKAIRKDEILSPIHSHLVDQWDWEKVIAKEERTLETLIEHAIRVYQTLRKTAIKAQQTSDLPEKPLILHSEDLLQRYPSLSAKEREHEICKEYGAVILLGIGGALSSGEPHDLRAPDYDDWSTLVDGKPGLNADILVWDEVRQTSLEISSMGIRVDEVALEKQLNELGVSGRKSLPFHKALLNGKLPYTIGGGIGQSRVAMFTLKEAEISKVQAIF